MPAKGTFMYAYKIEKKRRTLSVRFYILTPNIFVFLCRVAGVRLLKFFNKPKCTPKGKGNQGAEEWVSRDSYMQI